ncbi:hypothetical protein Vlu01_35280 [Micromonospora lutea]|uniref:Uncharacterized protein n=1 Tax=Micromonospora lutea TaxID=419825 RepID=A0ABQ4IYB2_9ACTN|nr:hypothetical protein Vlu01_35280 [Micromonospora lutea]
MGPRTNRFPWPLQGRSGQHVGERWQRGRNQPTPEQVADARAFLLDRFLRDCPWASPADRANYVALLVTPIAAPGPDMPERHWKRLILILLRRRHMVSCSGRWAGSSAAS